MKVGGASGPLYGTLFMTLGKEIAAERRPRRSSRPRLAKAIDAVKARGKSEAGQKTMLDVLVPGADALRGGREPRPRSPTCADAAAEATDADEGDPRPRLLSRRPLDRPHGSRRALDRADRRGASPKRLETDA